VRAHRRAAGARGKRRPARRPPPGEPADHALGRSRGGFTTKLHLVTDGTGLPLAVALSAGQAHESEYVAPVLNAVRIPRRGAGRRRCRPRTLAGDKGYSYPHIRRWLRRHHARAVIPEREDQRKQRAHRPGRKPRFDRAAYRRRHVIEAHRATHPRGRLLTPREAAGGASAGRRRGNAPAEYGAERVPGSCTHRPGRGTLRYLAVPR
jgi:hypothetical protein